MSKRITYTPGPIGKVEVVRDFLPPPGELVSTEEGVKVTIALSKRSVDFFKAHARKSKIPYQRMIRRVLDEYAGAYSGRNRRG